mgnify:CR=1 FL=1
MKISNVMFKVLFLVFYFVSCDEAMGNEQYINLPNRTFTSEQTIVFEKEIKPLIENKFREDISDEWLICQRKLLKVKLYRVETIDGKNVYSVHLEFVVRITNRGTEFSHTTLRGQEALFIIKQGKVKDIMPFEEYITLTDEKEIKKHLDAVDVDFPVKNESNF